MTTEKARLRAAGIQVRARVGDKLGDVWWSLLIRGLLALALAVAALFWPEATLILLIRLIALFALADGVMGLLGWLRTRDLAAHLAPALISIAVGLILLFWPDLTGRLLLTILGLWALFQGVMLILAGFQTETDDPDRGPAMIIGTVAALVGLVLVIWPGTGVVTVSWAIGIAALLIGASLIYLALRLRRIDKRAESLRSR
jgi:uncharacterized membrane protein HdeD (DUF308 family)